MFGKVLIAAAMFVPGAAMAQDWRMATTSDGGDSVFFLDAQSVGSGGGKAHGNMLMVRADDPGSPIGAVEASVEFDCATNRRHVLNMIAYDRSDAELARVGQNDAWEDTPPNTQFATIAQMLCGKQAIPAKGYGAARPFTAGRAVLTKK